MDSWIRIFLIVHQLLIQVFTIIFFFFFLPFFTKHLNSFQVCFIRSKLCKIFLQTRQDVLYGSVFFVFYLLDTCSFPIRSKLFQITVSFFCDIIDFVLHTCTLVFNDLYVSRVRHVIVIVINMNKCVTAKRTYVKCSSKLKILSYFYHAILLKACRNIYATLEFLNLPAAIKLARSFKTFDITRSLKHLRNTPTFFFLFITFNYAYCKCILRKKMVSCLQDRV